MDSNGTVELGVLGGFVSTYVHSMDPKKRLTIPSEWRDQVGSPTALYVLPSLNEEHCLYVYPAREMVQRLEKLRRVSIGDTRARKVARFLASRSDMVSWDSQGRIRIKDELLDFAGVTCQVQMIGAFDHFELWSPKLWKETDSVDSVSMGEAFRYLDI